APPGLHLERLGARDHANAFDLVRMCALEQVQEHLFLFLAIGDDELAAILVIDAAIAAVGIQRAIAGHAETRLEAARRVVETGVDHAAVPRRGDRARVGFRLEQQYLASGERERARDGEADGTRSDHDAFHPIRHMLNLSCSARTSAASSRRLSTGERAAAPACR